MVQWLNNCVGKRNYTTFILLMIFVLLMVGRFVSLDCQKQLIMFLNELAHFFNQIVVQLIIEGGTATAIFVRCFTDKKGIDRELETIRKE